MAKSKRSQESGQQARQQEAAPPAAAAAAAAGSKKRRPKKRKAAEEQNLPQDELARRERQRKLRDLALRLRADGKEYKKARQKKHKPRRRVQLIIVPIVWQKKTDERVMVLSAAERVQELLRALGVKCDTDTTTELTPGQKFRSWEEKGVMLRVELGPKEAAGGTCILARCYKAGEVAQKETVAVGPQLCERVKQQLEDMGQTLQPPTEAAPAAAAAQGGEAAGGEEEQEEEGGAQEQAQEQASRKTKKVKTAAEGQAAAAAAAPAAAPAAAAQQQGRRQGKKQSAEELEGDFAGVPLLNEQGPGKKTRKKEAAAAAATAEVAAFQALGDGEEGGQQQGKKKKGKKHKEIKF